MDRKTNGRIKRIDRREGISRIGKIKIGKKGISKNGKEIPESVDYFIAAGNYENLFNQEFGEKPNSIEIIFLSDKDEESCYERFELRQGAKLYAYGDGEYFKVWDKKTDSYVDRDIFTTKDLIAKMETACESKCEEVLTLNFIIPRIKVLGFWSFTTKGKDSSIRQIVPTFDWIKSQAGTVKGVPFDLKVEFSKSQKPDSKSLFPVVQIVPNLSADNIEKIGTYIQAGTILPFMLNESKLEQIEVGNSQSAIDYKAHEAEIIVEPEKEEKPKGKLEKILQAITTSADLESLNKIDKLKDGCTWDTAELLIIGNTINTRKREIEELQQGLEGVM